MSQNYGYLSTWKIFKLRAENINILIDISLEKESQKINQKYSSISNTVKILKNLILQFTKKADNLQKNLYAITRIQQTQSQSQYYQKRIKQCEQLSLKLSSQIQQKKRKIDQKSAEVTGLKRNLMKLKLENIKLCMKMQQMQDNFSKHQQKQNMEIERQKRRKKISEDRMKATNGVTISNPLRQECNKLQVELFNKIDKVKQERQFVYSCFDIMRQKLRKQQKKSNIYGLTGSMLFKLQKNQQATLPKIIKPSDSKLIVYDVLRQKYRNHIKSQNKKRQQLNIQWQQFRKFTPMQVIGIIELKGGLSHIIGKRSEVGEAVKQGQRELWDAVREGEPT